VSAQEKRGIKKDDQKSLESNGSRRPWGKEVDGSLVSSKRLRKRNQEKSGRMFDFDSALFIERGGQSSESRRGVAWRKGFEVARVREGIKRTHSKRNKLPCQETDYAR